MSWKHLRAVQLDMYLTGWGIAKEGAVEALGFGEDGLVAATARYDPKKPLTGQIAYHHPDDGWTVAMTGRTVERDWNSQQRGNQERGRE